MENTQTQHKLRTDKAAGSVDGTRCLDFMPFTLDDVATVRQLVRRAPSRTCDFTVGGIFMWVDWFRYTRDITDNTLFIRGAVENDRRRAAFSLPIGSLPTPEAIDRVAEYCRRNHRHPVFTAVPEDCIDRFPYIDRVTLQELDGWADYLYDAEAIATLRGKHYNKKRNHVNRFKADNPHYALEAITAENIAEVIGAFIDLGSEERVTDPMAIYEREQCLRVLVHIDIYGFDGAVLRDESGRIVALTVGETVGDTLFVHIEKMSHHVPGSGETIAHLFAARMLDKHPEIQYINREEDLNDPGLHRAKMSYHPTLILHKYNLYL